MKIKVVYLLNYEIMKIKSQNLEKKLKKKDIFNNSSALFDGTERVDTFESGIFPIKIEDTGFLELARVTKLSLTICETRPLTIQMLKY